jgi:hypothetical protein
LVTLWHELLPDGAMIAGNGMGCGPGSTPKGGGYGFGPSSKWGDSFEGNGDGNGYCSARHTSHRESR